MIKAIQYQKDILSGKIPSCKWVKLAMKRQINDLKNGKKRGLIFDEVAANRAISFFSFLKHWKGRHSGQRFDLLPWQEWMIMVLYGWKKTDGSRRFRYSYAELARKNGKTTLAGGNALFALIADGEAGAEIYTAATKRDQAKIAFNDAKSMVQNSPDLSKVIEIYQHNLHVTSTLSKLEPLSSDQNTLDGLNPHFALVDEYHAHKDDGLYNVLKSGMGSRKQPLLYVITTAGFNKFAPCYAMRRTCCEILEGIKHDDAQFALIYTLDEDDDWQDEKTWIKANPSLGASISLEFLKQEVLQAQNNPTQMVNLLTKNFNIWTDASQVWIEDKHWQLCEQEIDLESLHGLPCYGGLDLASKRDLNAFTLIFPKEEELISITWYWLPELMMQDRVRKDGVRYDLWSEQSHITLTEGNVTDQRKIKLDIMAICEAFDVQMIAFDRWNSDQLVLQLMEEGIEMKPYGQGFASMSTPTKTFESKIYEGKFIHNGNPVTRWMLSNVELMRDPAGNIKPDKSKSTEKIDGIVSNVMAIGIYLWALGEGIHNGPSIYEQGGGLTVI